MLILMSRPASERGSISDRAFLAFKLHRFISGAGNLYSTLREPGQRRITLDGQLVRSRRSRGAPLSDVFLSKLRAGVPPRRRRSRRTVSVASMRGPIDDTPLADEDRADQAGYLMPEPEADAEFTFDGSPEQYPEDWDRPRRPDQEQPAARPAAARDDRCRWCRSAGRDSAHGSSPASSASACAARTDRRAGPRNQQARGPIRGRPKLGDHPCWSPARCDG